jgi:hypothetical protein
LNPASENATSAFHSATYQLRKPPPIGSFDAVEIAESATSPTVETMSRLIDVGSFGSANVQRRVVVLQSTTLWQIGPEPSSRHKLV